MTVLEITLPDIQASIAFVSMIAFLWLLIEFKGMKDAIKEKTGISNESLRLKMQAYERITLYTERSGLKNLINRLPMTGEPALIAHERMITELRTEYEYNTSQQIYISTDVWNAVTKLRDQNIYIINQLFSGLPANATDADLGKRILEYSLNPNAELNTFVLDAIQFEAKQTLKNA